MHLKTLLFLLALTWTGVASAACTLPDGVEGEITYNKEWKIVQFCDGEKWRSMDASRAGGGGGGAAPSGAVMAFDLEDCPSGWSEYVEARGRFIRGIDADGTNDPAGVRMPGSLQDQDILAHNHKLMAAYGATGNVGMTYLKTWTYTSSYAQNFYTGTGGSSSYGTGPDMRDAFNAAIAGQETRPKNVALLYCRRD